MKTKADLFLPKNLEEEIISHCKEIYPYEACGILAGKDGIVQKVFKMTNIDKSNVSYMMDPGEQFAVMKEMRKEVLEMTAIYHSHPHTDAYPSLKDINLAFYEDSLYVIVSLIQEEPVIRAFTIKEGIVEESKILIIA